MAIRPPDTFRSSLKTTVGRLQLAVVVIVILHGLSVPLWLKGYWAPRSAVMRLLYQCLGSREDEQTRWQADVVLISACERPILTAVSPTQKRIGVWSRSHNEDWIVDVETGEVLLAVPHSGWGFSGFVTEDLVVRSLYERDSPPVKSSIYDIRTGEVFGAKRMVWEDPDLEDLKQLFVESNGNAVGFSCDRFVGLLFYINNGLQVRDFESGIPNAVQDLVDSWGIPQIKAPFFRAADRRVTAGDDTCLIGLETAPNPILWHPSFCFVSVAEPILLKP